MGNPIGVYNLEAIPLENFGGLNSLLDPTNLPPSASPDTQDVEFYPGLVQTRPGLTSVYAAIPGNPTIRGMVTYPLPDDLTRRFLAFDSTGTLYKDIAGTLTPVSTTIVPNEYMNAIPAFGREYMAFGDNKHGFDIPRQYDDTNFDRVSQIGPGAPPNAADEIVAVTLRASPLGLQLASQIAITATSEDVNLVTITTGAAHFYAVGDSINISGVTIAGYNQAVIITSVPTPTTFTYVSGMTGLLASSGGTTQALYALLGSATANTQTPGQRYSLMGMTNASWNGTYVMAQWSTVPSFGILLTPAQLAFGASGGGTMTWLGNIVIGVHKLSVAFVTRQGYITRFSPFSTWTSIGGRRVVVTGIPIGPANVIARIIAFTAAGGATFFYRTDTDPTTASSSMKITDNTTQTATFDFSDSFLLGGADQSSMFKLVELGEAAGVIEYASRLFWWGERAKIDNFQNLTFDGGFTNALPASPPLGWTLDPLSGVGGNRAGLTGQQIYWGDAYSITGAVSTAVRGLITQSAFQDYLGNPILLPNTAYSVRARLIKNAMLQGTVHINLKSISGGFTTAGITATAGQITTSYVEFIAPILTPMATIPSDLVLQVYADGTPTTGGFFVIDSIEIFPTANPYNNSLARVSKPDDPESYDGVTGLLQPDPSNGQELRCMFKIRDFLYVAKERSLYVTQDNGVTGPNQWTIQEVSNTVGAVGARAVGTGEEWALIANRNGLYYFDGGVPNKISQEIQPTWDAINWNVGYLIEVKVDTKRKRAYISIPYGPTATSCNRVLTLDFVEGFSNPTEGVLGSLQQISNQGSMRKWCPWMIPTSSMALVELDDGTHSIYFGSNNATGKIYLLDTNVKTDDGATIQSYWQSGYFQPGLRMLFGYLTANISGSGVLGLTLFRGGQEEVKQIRGWLLSTIGRPNKERQINIETERMAIKISTMASGDYFSLQGLAAFIKQSTWAPLRGTNLNV